ncbi:MAG: hypothetical protein ACRD1D_01860 [Acidimicrobiales bacterium]
MSFGTVGVVGRLVGGMVGGGMLVGKLVGGMVGGGLVVVGNDVGGIVGGGGNVTEGVGNSGNSGNSGKSGNSGMLKSGVFPPLPGIVGGVVWAPTEDDVKKLTLPAPTATSAIKRRFQTCMPNLPLR